MTAVDVDVDTCTEVAVDVATLAVTCIQIFVTINTTTFTHGCTCYHATVRADELFVTCNLQNIIRRLCL